MTKSLGASRRGFLAAAGGALAVAGVGSQVRAQGATSDVDPFFGLHQGGIVTPTQSHTYFAAFDLQAKTRADVAALLQRWTILARQLTSGAPADLHDSGEAVDLGSSRLTLTFGFGAGLFEKEGVDRYGLKAQRPAALVDVPRFNGDQMVEARCGGDLSVQACADDPQVAFHAVRRLAQAAYDVAAIRWTQAGFSSAAGKATPRNLMGFKDGTSDPAASSDNALRAAVWVGDEGPDWMSGGSYLVARRIRVALEHWDRMDLAYQEQTVGRRKGTGAPLGGTKETDPIDSLAVGGDGEPILPVTSHVRMATAIDNDGVLIHRRGYSYNDGVVFTAERWPPWHQGMEYDAGSFFLCYQRDPRTGFLQLFRRMSKMDAMNQFTTHVGGGLFACPSGVADEASFIGMQLLGA